MQGGIVACGGSSRVNETLNDRFVGLAGVSGTFEAPLAWEGDMLKPIEQLVLLTKTDVGDLTGVCVGIDKARAEEAAWRETGELVLSMSPAMLVEGVLDKLLLALCSFVKGGLGRG